MKVILSLSSEEVKKAVEDYVAKFGYEVATLVFLQEADPPENPAKIFREDIKIGAEVYAKPPQKPPTPGGVRLTRR